MKYNKWNKGKQGNNNGSKTTWGGGTAQCHTGNVLVFTTSDGIEVYAGGSSRSGGWWLMEEIPDLAMGPDDQVSKGMPGKYATRGLDAEKWSCMDKVEKVEPKNLLAIDFPDFKVPQDLGREFWEQLVIDIRENEVKTIHCMCMGGHGRTGVQLAILRYLLATDEEKKQWADANELITAIRKPYCDKAVEANGQQDYVAEMCGIDSGPYVGFHKGQYGGSYSASSGWGGTKSSVKRTNYNAKLLECTSCDFTTWESKKTSTKESDWCYDISCTGKLEDISKYSLDRDKAGLDKDSCLCLNCLQPVSDIQIMSVAKVTDFKEIMETLHGGDWNKLLQSQQRLNSAGTLKGVLLRHLSNMVHLDDKGRAKLTTEEIAKIEQGVIVATSCILCNITMNNNDNAPDYKKGDRGFVHHVKCDYCHKKVSPHILTMARDTKQNVNCKACFECIEGSKNKFYFRDEIKAEAIEGAIIDGLSPQSWLRLTDISVFDDENKETDNESDNEKFVQHKGGDVGETYGSQYHS